MLNKELDKATCVAYSAISNDSAASGKLVDRQFTGMPSAAKSLNKQTGALNQHIFAGFTDNTSADLGVSLRASAGSMCDQTSQANLNRLNKFLQLEPDKPAVFPEPDSQPEMNRLNVDSIDKFRLGSATEQRPVDGNNNQFDTDSDSVQLLDECNSSETDSDLQIVFPNHSSNNDSLVLTNARTVKPEKSPDNTPLIDLASSSSDGSSNTDIHMNEDTDDSDRASSPKHTLDDHELNNSANSSNFDAFSLNLPSDHGTSDQGKNAILIHFSNKLRSFVSSDTLGSRFSLF